MISMRRSALILVLCSCISTNSCQSSVEETSIDEPEKFLTHIGNSGRISSNHYSDVVMDSRGCAYVASFFTKPDGRDYIKIIKVSPTGKILWTEGTTTLGRATALTIDGKDNLIVTGFYESKLNIGDIELQSDGLSHLFILKLKTDGSVVWVKNSNNDSKAYDINVNTKGDILIAGLLAEKEKFGEVEVTKELQNAHFFARFDSSGNCKWVKQFNGKVRRIKSDSLGHFYICGGFGEYLFAGDSAYTTESTFDHDGFIMQVDEDVNWVKVIGLTGTIRNGYRTYDVMSDLDIDEDGFIWVMSSIESSVVKDATTSFISGSVIKYDHDGNQLDSLYLISSLARGAVSGLCVNQGEIIISGSEYQLQKTQAVSQCFIKHFTQEGSLIKEVPIENEPNTMMRSTFSNSSGTVYTGHFKQYLKIDSIQIENDGSHGLFMYRPD
jgi:hypothetical protein